MIGGFLGALSDKGERQTDTGWRRHGTDTVQARRNSKEADIEFRLEFRSRTMGTQKLPPGKGEQLQNNRSHLGPPRYG